MVQFFNRSWSMLMRQIFDVNSSMHLLQEQPMSKANYVNFKQNHSNGTADGTRTTETRNTITDAP